MPAATAAADATSLVLIHSGNHVWLQKQQQEQQLYWLQSKQQLWASCSSPTRFPSSTVYSVIISYIFTSLTHSPDEPQVEGAWDEGGRSPSIWDTFSQQPGHTYGNATGNVAADHFHQYQQDIKLMLALGVKHYRCAGDFAGSIPRTCTISWCHWSPFGTHACSSVSMQQLVVNCWC